MGNHVFRGYTVISHLCNALLCIIDLSILADQCLVDPFHSILYLNQEGVGLSMAPVGLNLESHCCYSNQGHSCPKASHVQIFLKLSLQVENDKTRLKT